MSSDNAQQRGHSAGVSLPLLLRTGNVVLLLSRVTLGVLLLPQTFARYIRQALYHPPPLCGCALLLLELDLSSINQLNLPREKKKFYTAAVSIQHMKVYCENTLQRQFLQFVTVFIFLRLCDAISICCSLSISA